MKRKDVSSDYAYMASIDIGKVNFAFCVEKFDKNKILNIENIPLKDRYTESGTPTKNMENILNSIYANGQIVLHDNVNITQNCDKKKTLDPETFHNMTDLLDKYSEYWDLCEVIVIEKQMSFRGKVNTMALKLGQHCYSYFTFRYGRFKKVIEYEAYYKTHVLGAPKTAGRLCKNGKTKYKTMEQRDRKKWAVQKGLEILKFRKHKCEAVGDTFGDKSKDDITECIEKIENSKKKDDLCDCFIQGISFRYLYYVEKMKF
jgi:hypothetical protein